MEKFLYVFTREDRDALLDAGMSMLKSDEKRNIYIFINQKITSLNFSEITFMLSNVLTF